MGPADRPWTLELHAFPFGIPLVFIATVLLAHGVVGIALERRADDYAASSDALARALDTIADSNKTMRRTGCLWNVLQQHPGLEPRIRRLQGRYADTVTAAGS